MAESKAVTEAPPPDRMNWAGTDLPYFIPHQARFKRPALQINDVVKTLIEARGNLALAARLLGRSRQSIVAFVDREPACQHLIRELRNTLLDDAEHNYARAVEHGNLEASKFVLTTFGKDRGYTKPGTSGSVQDSHGNKVSFTIEG
jgi:hypothetical protein